MNRDLRAAVAILGDPSWCKPDVREFANTPLLRLERRDAISMSIASGARDFMRQLKCEYPTGHFEYREYPRSDHFMEPDEWDDGWNATLEWFAKHLPTR